jgi:hypothetical protein
MAFANRGLQPRWGWSSTGPRRDTLTVRALADAALASPVTMLRNASCSSEVRTASGFRVLLMAIVAPGWSSPPESYFAAGAKPQRLT